MSNTGFITAVYFAVKNAAVVATVVEILINVVVEGVIECCFRRQSFKAHFVNSLSVVAIVAVTVVLQGANKVLIFLWRNILQIFLILCVIFLHVIFLNCHIFLHV